MNQPHSNPRITSSRIVTGTLLVAALALPLAAHSQNEFIPGKWMESGLSEHTLGYRPLSLPLATVAPAGLKQAPTGLVSPRYGSLKTGGAANSVAHLVLVDFAADGKPVRLFVDAEGNGEWTASDWTAKTFERPEGAKGATYYAEATVKLTADGSRRGKQIFYISQTDLSQPAAVPKFVSYHTDCGLAGEFKIAGHTYAGIMADSPGAGEFAAGTTPGSMPIFWVDANGNGKTDRGETGLAGRPFEADGKWWVATNLAPSGAFQIVAGQKPVAPKPAVDLSPGKKAPAFTGKLLAGKEVKFPGDYQGKVVLVDFWATWCGPCVAEIPNVVKAYGKYHDQGLEVLGISLDKEGMEQKVAEFTKRKAMPWPQVYDGKFWSAAVAKLYGINSIPHMLLVDGDTGVILADKDIRGEALAPAIEKALAAKKK